MSLERVKEMLQILWVSYLILKEDRKIESEK